MKTFRSATAITKLAFAVAFLSLLTLAGVRFVQAAWTPPTSAPPGGNVAAPLNVSGVSQTKQGSLTIGGEYFSLSGGDLLFAADDRGVFWDTVSDLTKPHIESANDILYLSPGENAGSRTEIQGDVKITTLGIATPNAGSLTIENPSVGRSLVFSAETGASGVDIKTLTSRLMLNYDVSQNIHVGGAADPKVKLCLNDASETNCIDDWSDIGGGVGSGTAWYIPRWDTPTTLTDSVMYQRDDGFNNHFIGINDTFPGATLTLGPTSNTSLLSDIDLNPFPNYLWRIKAIGSIGTLQDKRFYISAEDGDGSNALAINRLGETGLGVGTAIPTAMLHVKGRADGGIMDAGLINSAGVNVTQGGGQTYFDMFGPGDYIRAVGQTRVINNVINQASLTTTVAFAPPIANQPYDITPSIARFADNTGTTRLLINPEGKIGIGTIDPQQVLHVVGNARISGLTCSGLLNGGKVTTNANGDLICGDDTGGGGGGDTYMVKTNGTDTANFLNAELLAGANITLSAVNVGGDLKLQIAASGSGASLWEAGGTANTINPLNETTDKVAIGRNDIADSTQLSVKNNSVNSAIYAEQSNASGWAGYFSGNVTIDGNSGGTSGLKLTDLINCSGDGVLETNSNGYVVCGVDQGGTGGIDNYTVKTNGSDTANYLATELVAGTNVSIDTTTVSGDLRTRINFSGGSGLPTGSSGDTLRHNGTSWIANNILFNNGSQVSVGITDPANRFEVGQDIGGYMALRRDAATITALQDLGALYFTGDDGATDAIGAQIKGRATAEWSANDYPTKLMFLTAPDGGTALERMTILDNGNVGISNSAPTYKMDVTDTLRLVASGRTDGVLTEHTGSGNYRTGMLSTGLYQVRANRIGFVTPEGSSTDRLFINAAGNVGVGTTNPLEALHVVGNVRIPSLANCNGVNTVDTDANGNLVCGADVGGGAGDNLGNHIATQNLQMGTNYISSDGGTGEGINIDAAGRVALSNIPNGGGETFQLREPAGGSEWAGLGYDGGNNNLNVSVHAGSQAQTFQIDYDDPVFSFDTHTNPDALVIKKDGSVGIGTTSPTGSRLEVNGGYIRARNTNGNYTGYQFADDDGLQWSWYKQNAADPSLALGRYIDGTWQDTPVVFGRNGTVEFLSGNVGIGDSSPASALTVGNGDLFQVNSSGNIVKINNVTYSWPAAQGAANSVLSNNGSGALSWATMTSLPGGSANQMLRHNGTAWTADSTVINTGSKIGISNTSPAGLLSIASSTAPYGTNHTVLAYNNAATTAYNAVSGYKSGASVRGSAIYGEFVSGASCGSGQVCAGVYGSDGYASYPVQSGTWAGYFNGDVNIADQIKITGGGPASGKVLTAIDTLGNARWDPAVRLMSGITGWIGADAYTGEISISALGCTEWPNIQVYSANETYPDRWGTDYEGTGWTGGAVIGYKLYYVDTDSFQIYNENQTKRFRWVAVCR